MSDSPSPDSPGRFSYDGLDRVLHEKARLGVLVSLSTRPKGLLFAELKQLCRADRRQSQPAPRRP